MTAPGPATIIEFTTKRYRCSVCGKSYATKSRTRAHINRGCVHDPETRACPTCRYDIRGGYEEGPGGCGMGVRPDGVYCARGCSSWAGRSS